MKKRLSKLKLPYTKEKHDGAWTCFCEYHDEKPWIGFIALALFVILFPVLMTWKYEDHKDFPGPLFGGGVLLAVAVVLFLGTFFKKIIPRSRYWQNRHHQKTNQQ